MPEPYDKDVFTLEGQELHIIEQGTTDADASTSVYVPSIDLVVGGDVFYNQCHMMVAASTPESRANGLTLATRSAVGVHRPAGATRQPVTGTLTCEEEEAAAGWMAWAKLNTRVGSYVRLICCSRG